MCFSQSTRLRRSAQAARRRCISSEIKRHKSPPILIHAPTLCLPAQEAIAALHASEVVHGDIRPSNMLLTGPLSSSGPQPQLRLAGFQCAFGASEANGQIAGLLPAAPEALPYTAPEVQTCDRSDTTCEETVCTKHGPAVTHNRHIKPECWMWKHPSNSQKGLLGWHVSIFGAIKIGSGVVQVLAGGLRGKAGDMWAAGCVIAELLLRRQALPCRLPLQLLEQACAVPHLWIPTCCKY